MPLSHIRLDCQRALWVHCCDCLRLRSLYQPGQGVEASLDPFMYITYGNFQVFSIISNLPSKMLLPTTYFFLCYSALCEAFQIPLKKPNTSPFTPAFDKLVAETLDHWHTPGVSIAVVDGDQTFSKVYVRAASSRGPLNSTGLRHRDLS